MKNSELIQRMAVDGELHRDEAARVDETQAVRLVRLESRVPERRLRGARGVAVLPDAVDGTAVRDGLVAGGAGDAPWGEVVGEEVGGPAVVEVGELDDEVAVVGGDGFVFGVDDERADDAVRVLRHVV